MRFPCVAGSRVDISAESLDDAFDLSRSLRNLDTGFGALYRIVL